MQKLALFSLIALAVADPAMALNKKCPGNGLILCQRVFVTGFQAAAINWADKHLFRKTFMAPVPNPSRATGSLALEPAPGVTPGYTATPQDSGGYSEAITRKDSEGQEEIKKSYEHRKDLVGYVLYSGPGLIESPEKALTNRILRNQDYEYLGYAKTGKLNWKYKYADNINVMTPEWVNELAWPGPCKGRPSSSSTYLDTSPTEFTIPGNGQCVGRITRASTGLRTFPPPTLTWASSPLAQNFGLTPTNVGSSSQVVSTSVSPSLANSTAGIAYRVVPSATTISVNDANWAEGRSPYNWYVSGSSYISAVNPGAYFKVGFTGTSVAVDVDTSSLSGQAEQYPRISYSIDGGAAKTYQLTSGDTQIPLASGLTSGTHRLTLWFLSSDAYLARWNGANALKVTGLVLDSGARTVALTLLPKRLITFGDSITEGAWELGNHNVLTNYSDYEESNVAYVAGVAGDLDAEYGQIAFGGQSWQSSFKGDIPPFRSAWRYYFGSNSRLVDGLLNPAPDYLLVNMGTNGGVSAGTVVSAWLAEARAAAGVRCDIFVIIPFNQTAATTITAGFNAYKTSSGDTRVFLINLGSKGVTYSTSPTYSYDGLHPNLLGQAHLRTLITDAIRSDISTRSANSLSGISASSLSHQFAK